MKSISTILFSVFFFSFITLQVSGQYSLEKEVSPLDKIGSKASVPIVESMYSKGSSLYFMGDNSVIVTDNKGLLVKKISPIRKISLGYTTAIGNVSFDTDNNYYLYDGLNINKYNSNQDLINSFSVADYFDFYERNGTVAIETDNQKNIYFGGQNYFITVFDKDGNFIRKIGKKGDADGQFYDIIKKIVVDDDGNVYVRSGNYDYNTKIQVFNKDGVFQNKIILNNTINDFSVDKKGNIYILKTNSNSILVYDKTAKLSSTILASSNKDIYPQYISFSSDNNIIVDILNSASRKREFIIIDNPVLTDNFVFTPYNSEFPTKILDIKIHPVSKNLVVLDQFKIATYDKDYKFVKSNTDLDKGIVAKFSPVLFNFDEKGKMYFARRGPEVFDYTIYSEDKPSEALCKFTADNFVIKFIVEKDSLSNTVLLATTAYSVKSYGLDGKLKKTHISSSGGYIKQFNKNADGSFLLIDTWNGKIQNYDKNFKLTQTKSTSAFILDEFAVSDDGNIHTIDESFNKLKLETYDSNGKFICSSLFDVNYPLRSTISNFNDKLVFAGLYRDSFSVVGFNYKTKLKGNDISGGNAIQLTTLDKSKDLKSIFSSSAKNLIYKVFNGESVKVSSDGALEVLKGGETILEISSPETIDYNAASIKVLVTVTKVDQTVTGVSNFEKSPNDSDFIINVKSDVDIKPIVTFASGESVSFNAQTGTVKILKEGISSLKVLSPETDKRKGYISYIYITVAKPKKISASIVVSNYVKKIDDAEFTVTSTSNSTSKMEYSVGSGDAVNVTSDGKIKILKAGVSTLAIFQAENTTYASTTVYFTVTVNKLEQLISVENIPISVYQNNTPFEIKATSNAGLTVESKILSGPAKLESNKIVLDGGVGIIVIEFSQKGNEKYSSAIVVKKSVEVKVVLGVTEELQDMGIKVFPNPTASKLIISSQGKPTKLTIFNSLGKSLFEIELLKSEDEVDISQLPAGSYILNIEQKDKRKSVRILKL